METNPKYGILLSGFAQWLKVQGYAARTIEARTAWVRRYLQWLSTAPEQQISVASISAWLAYLESRPQRRGGALAGSSLNAAIAAVKRFAAYLPSAGYPALESLPAYIETQTPDYRILSRAEIATLYQSAEESPRDLVLLALYYACGLRLSEGLKLSIGDIDSRRAYLHVRQGKGGKSRAVPLVGRALDDLVSWLESGRSRYQPAAEERALVLNYRGERLGQSGAAHSLRQLSARAGLAPLAPHQLRHTIATHLLEAGMSLEAIAHFLGHTSPASTVLYTHIIEGRHNAGI